MQLKSNFFLSPAELKSNPGWIIPQQTAATADQIKFGRCAQKQPLYFYLCPREWFLIEYSILRASAPIRTHWRNAKFGCLQPVWWFHDKYLNLQNVQFPTLKVKPFTYQDPPWSRAVCCDHNISGVTSKLCQNYAFLCQKCSEVRKMCLCYARFLKSTSACRL